MCGIAGVFLRGESCDLTRLTRMRDVMAHRGPDDADNFIEGPLGLCHRRLSIIDLGTGHQPMATADGRYTIVFNGEIYNYRELRRELESAGASFRTQSDTEVILHLHAHYGDAAAARLNGIFAYALWDRITERLLLVRDRAGIKPLYYAASARGVVFASEVKALFESALLQPRLDERHVAEYLVFRHVAGPDNLFAGVLALAPGHTVEVVAGAVATPKQYWSVEAPCQPFSGDYEAAVDALDAALRDAVKRQMVADVPLGTFCSGGIDSSLVTAIAAQRAGVAVNTYSVGFAEAGYDESDYARMAARACGTEHHELRVDEARFAELLPRLIWHHDLPLNFANSVHIFAVSELARRDVKVVLTGEGADELFGGYPRYYIPRIAASLDRYPAIVRAPIAALLRAMPDHRLRNLGAYAASRPGERLLFNPTNVGLEAVAAVSAFPATPERWTFRTSAIVRAQQQWTDAFTAMSQLDFQTYLLSILNRQDKMSMAASLESRVPFLDNEIIDLARSFPPEFKQSFRHRKRVLKDVARRHLPAAIVDRRKSGFGVPLPLWFRSNGPLSALLNGVLEGRELGDLFDPSSLRRVAREHRSGERDHSELLWSVLNLGVWRVQFRC